MFLPLNVLTLTHPSLVTDFVATDYSSVPAPALTSSVEFLDSMPSKSSRIEEMEREVREQGRLDRSLSGVMRSLEEMTVRFLKPEPILSPSRQSTQSVQSLRDESIQSPSRQSVKSLRSSVRSSQDSGLSSSSPLRQLLNASRDLQNSRSASSQPRPSANSPLRVLLRASRASSMASSIGDTFEFPDSDFDEQGEGFSGGVCIFLCRRRFSNVTKSPPFAPSHLRHSLRLRPRDLLTQRRQKRLKLQRP